MFFVLISKLGTNSSQRMYDGLWRQIFENSFSLKLHTLMLTFIPNSKFQLLAMFLFVFSIKLSLIRRGRTLSGTILILKSSLKICYWTHRQLQTIHFSFHKWLIYLHIFFDNYLWSVALFFLFLIESKILVVRK